MTLPGLSWIGIFRLGTVQMCLGAMFVLMTSIINRVIVVELALPAAFAGGLLAVHYAMQMLRPHFGHGSDSGGRRTTWIIGGMFVLAVGATLAAVSTMVMSVSAPLGMTVAVFAFALVGSGVGAGGTSLLVLVAAKVVPKRRAAAACITWSCMIFGFVVATEVASRLLEPFSTVRMLAVIGGICAVAFVVSVAAVWGIEDNHADVAESTASDTSKTSFMVALKQVMVEPQTRIFGLFIALSMFAYGLQELVLEPFGGAVLGMTPAESTSLTGKQNMGVLLGMIAMGIIGSRNIRTLRTGVSGGCLASALCLVALVLAPTEMALTPVVATVFALGFANGVFAVAAVGNMMHLVGQGTAGREGIRMGVWGSAQAIAMGAGSVVGTLMVDAARWIASDTMIAYASVFSIQAGLFFIAALLALGIRTTDELPREHAAATSG